MEKQNESVKTKTAHYEKWRLIVSNEPCHGVEELGIQSSDLLLEIENKFHLFFFLILLLLPLVDLII